MKDNVRARSFLITGVTSELGRTLAQAALNEGHTVIGTVPSDAARKPLEALSRDKAHAVVLDVTDFDAIPAAVAAIEEKFGPLDVLVNNAGYGREATLEESPLDEGDSEADCSRQSAYASTSRQ
jgi:NAD(P)-dependent dehydrogenase (short-subunit alcohol dehydrogenase family)